MLYLFSILLSVLLIECKKTEMVSLKLIIITTTKLLSNLTEIRRLI